MRFKILFFLFCITGYWGISQESEIDSLLFTNDFFEINEPLSVSLELSIRRFQRGKFREEYVPAKLQYTVQDTIPITEDVRVKTRGVARIRICHFPPYWLNIKTSNIDNDEIANRNKVKVVSHCKNMTSYEDYLLREYLCYKLFNIITDYSFRARLLNITYKDTKAKVKDISTWAFILEPELVMAQRLNAFPIEIDKMTYNQSDTLRADIVSMFQFMIGNTDFSIYGRHNIKLLKLDNMFEPYLIPIPYDFDFAGLINTDYANPAEGLDIENVRQRYYVGMCRSDEEYDAVIKLFLEKKEEIYYFLNNFDYLSSNSMADIADYVNQFYRLIERPNFIENYIRPNCRKNMDKEMKTNL